MISKNNQKLIRYLGIDYGQAKIGLAIASGETKMAFGYGSLENDKELFAKIAEIIKKEEISMVVIGLPSYNNKKKAQDLYFEFGNSLKMAIPKVDIAYADEMFSTKMAQDNLKEKGMKRIKNHDHQEAARIILQGWLDSTAIRNQ